MICYHFVSKESLSQIKKDGFLKPNTKIFVMKNIDRLHKKYGMSDKDYKEIKKFVQKLPKNKFIVTTPKNRLKDWIKSGLIRDIHHFIKPNYKLEFETLNNCKMYIREHVYQSPKEVDKIF